MPTNKTKDGFDVMVDSKKTVLVFGTFDCLHDGHRFFLREAHRHGARLVVSVAQDSAVKELKGRPPRTPLSERLAGLRASGLADEVIPGDTELGSWTAVKKYHPDIIALGHDQTGLETELRVYIKRENLPIQLVIIPAYHRNRLRSSLLP